MPLKILSTSQMKKLEEDSSEDDSGDSKGDTAKRINFGLFRPIKSFGYVHELLDSLPFSLDESTCALQVLSSALFTFGFITKIVTIKNTVKCLLNRFFTV